MTDEKQIEEMAKAVRSILESRTDITFIPDLDKPIAEELAKKYQPKLPENAVVLTKEEYEMILETQKHLEKKYSDMRDELNLSKNENEIIKQNYIQLKQDNEQARKETAREILQQGKYCLSSSLREWIIEQYGVEVD